MTNTEKLMICAKAVEYQIVPADDSDDMWVFSPDRGTVKYNPLTNDAQAFELLRWLINHTEKNDSVLIDSIYSPESTFNEAIVNTVVMLYTAGGMI